MRRPTSLRAGTIAAFLLLPLLGAAGKNAATAGAAKALMVRGESPGAPAAEVLTAAARAAGLEPAPVDLSDVAESAWWDRLTSEIVCLSDARRLPASSRDGLLAFLARGGHIVCVGAPLLADPLFRDGGRWTPARELAAKRSATGARTPFDSLAPPGPGAWQRSSDSGTVGSRLTAGAGEHGPELRLAVRGMRSWDNFGRIFAGAPFPDGNALTCFWARGSRPDDRMTIEWQEADGSRWIAAIPLGTNWRHYALPPADFLYWSDSPTGSSRGGAGDRFHPERAAKLVIGFAASHGSPAGDRRVEVAALGSAPDPYPELDRQAAPPIVEALSPAYKLYPLAGGLRAMFPSASGRWSLFPAGGFAPIRRHSGIGYGSSRYERLVPILEAQDAGGADRGAAIWRMMRAEPGSAAQAWVCVGIRDPGFWRDNRDLLVESLSREIARLSRGTLLLAAGADRFTAMEGDAVTFGARVVNLTAGPATATVTAAWRPTETGGIPANLPRLRVDLGPRASADVSWPPVQLAPGHYQIHIDSLGSMQRGDDGSDALTHEFDVLQRPARSSDQVTVQDGHFQLGGKRWFALGVNFWPRSVIGREGADYRRSWLDPAMYDPAVVERDLEAVRTLGMNCVSIQYSDPAQALPLRDFLRRCGERGIRANIYLSGANPLHFDPALVRRLIQAADLAHNPAVFAYDLAWEPVWGTFRERRRYDAEWRAWIDRRYPDIHRAEVAWGAPANRDEDGRVTGPTDAQVTTDGAWRKMVADYRRFQDDLLDRRYAEIRRLIRSLDSHALLGARTGWGGGPFINSPSMPFDHASGVRQLDFVSPEAWGLREGGPEIGRGAFIAAYDRAVSGGKPVFWAEVGHNCGYPLPGVTAPGRAADSQRELQRQRDYIQAICRMARQTDSDGVMAWWLPGGYRVDERSDFGILNPDATLRPAAQALVESGRPGHPPAARPPDTWITVDRFADARGPFALWSHYSERFAREQEARRTVGLRVEGGIGERAPQR